MKKWAKMLCCFALVGFMLVGGLAGCATVSNIKNDYEGIIYNGTSAVRVGDYLYFANAYSDSGSFTKDSDYTNATKNSYLARVNLENLDAKNPYFSPKKVENVSSEVTGFGDSFMFVLGQNIYYATPNRQMMKNDSGQSAYFFNYTTIFKSGLNGDGKTKLYTTSDEISQIEALKFEDKYYIVMLAGQKIIKIDLKSNKVTTLAENVTSVAIPKTCRTNANNSTLDWNGQIYFTTARDSESALKDTNLLKKIGINETDPQKAETVYTQGNVTLISREQDVIFFSESKTNIESAVYKLDVKANPNSSDFYDAAKKKQLFFSGSTVTDLTHIATKSVDYGYIYTANSSLRYSSNNGKSGKITLMLNDTELSSYKTLCVIDRIIYLSTTSGIYSADLSNVFINGGANVQIKCKEIVSMTGIADNNLHAFDGKYIYFYASLQTIPDESQDESENETEEETDDNLYLYRANISGDEGFQLLGLTAISSRHTK